MSKDKYFYLVLAISILITIPYLGLTDFYTKGEPREAIVALTMLDTDNWIMPVNNGIDIAYKPPFFHWCIASISSVYGDINEYTSRLPSALSFIFLVAAIYWFFQKKNRKSAFGTSLVFMTFFESHRAAFACRVDMMLTLFIVLSLFLLYHWIVIKSMRGLPLSSILFINLGILTKGPVALILPFLVSIVYLLFRKQASWKCIFVKFFYISFLSCILPALWYYSAWLQEGDSFLKLIYEENIGRMIGTMSYQSHSGYWYMNLVYLLSGMMPYTIILLFMVPLLKSKIVVYISNIKNKACLMPNDPMTLFNVVAITVIFIFYCIPDSKRSVYLLPMYPFLAYFVYKLVHNSYLNKICKYFENVVFVLIILMLSLYLLVRLGVIIPSASSIDKYIDAIKEYDMKCWQYCILLMPIFYFIVFKVRTESCYKVMSVECMVLLLFLCLDSVYQPIILNTKSDKSEAKLILNIAKSEKIYTYCSGNMMRFFAINFYSHDKLQPIRISPEELKSSYFGQVKSEVDSGFLLVPNNDIREFMEVSDGQYHLTSIYSSSKKGCDVRDYYTLYKFKKKIE